MLIKVWVQCPKDWSKLISIWSVISSLVGLWLMTLFIVHIFYAHSPILPMIFLLILAIVFIISPFFNHIWFLHCTVVGLIYRCSNLSCPYWITFTSPRITKLTSLCHSFPFFSNRPSILPERPRPFPDSHRLNSPKFDSWQASSLHATEKWHPRWNGGSWEME